MDVTNKLSPEQNNTILSTGNIVDLDFLFIFKTHKHNIRFRILLSHFFFLSLFLNIQSFSLNIQYAIVSNAI